jgi:hypothetical protein
MAACSNTTPFLTLLLHSVNSAVEKLIGTPIVRWHNMELPKPGLLRVDLLGETADGELIHIELQSTNDPFMALRMAEYAVHMYCVFKRLPRQIVIYVGHAEMKMASELIGPQLTFHYALIDINSLDSEPLLQSSLIADNLLAILTRLQDQRAAVRHILARIATLEPDEKRVALKQLLILAGLRKLGSTIATELQTMLIEEDIMDHDLFGPMIRQSRQEESLHIVRRQLKKRFGKLPPPIEQHMSQLPANERRSFPAPSRRSQCGRTF